MEGSGPILFIAAGLFLGGFAAWHEMRWLFRTRYWKRVSGVVVGSRIDEEMSSFSEIEFLYNGTPKRFVSDYSDEGPALGSTVEVIFDPKSGAAERYCISNRWVFTLVPGILAIAFLWAGLSAKTQPAEQVADDQLPARAESEVE